MAARIIKIAADLNSPCEATIIETKPQKIFKDVIVFAIRDLEKLDLFIFSLKKYRFACRNFIA